VQPAEIERCDMVILDWMLPGWMGSKAVGGCADAASAPILMLTVRTEEVDRVLGREVGADDYLSKPVSIRELLASVRAIFWRI
jgi:two-component system response regulator RstA